MKQLYALLLATILLPTTLLANEESNKKFDFYGFIRTDLFYNSRDNVAGFNEIFYLYPMDVELDAAGNDLNGDSTSGIFAFITRLGVNLNPHKIGSASVSGKVEVDFGGYGSFNMLLRLRHAYFDVAWESGHSLIFGQTWHPLFGNVMPYMNNVSTGAPYQPFSRAPQIRYTYKNGGLELLAAAMCQIQYNSSGPNGTSNEYQLNSSIPEVYIGGNYYADKMQFGGGINILTIAPRTTSTIGDQTYSVDETMTSVSGEVHLRYTNNKFHIGAKTIYASALDHMAMLGGYGVTSIDSTNGEQQYAPLHNSTTWVNITYGKKWKPSLFVGYTKNLGSSEALISTDKIYGRGLDIDQLLGINAGFTYNPSSALSFGLEYSPTVAWYGDINLSSGRVYNTHDITNHRVVGTATYYF